MKRTNVLIVSIAVAMTVFLAGFAAAAETATTASGGCTDSDGGKVYDVKGIANGQNGMKTDNCANPTRLKEYYCEGGLAKEQLVLCMEGCVSGRCRSTEVTELSASTARSKPTPLGAITGITTSTSTGASGVTTTSTIALVSKATVIVSVTIKDCSDSDGGRNQYAKGMLTYFTLKYEDACLTPVKLREHFCSLGGLPEVVLFRCKHGCANGACNMAPGQTVTTTVTTSSTTSTTVKSVTQTTLTTSTTMAAAGGGTCTDSDGGKDYEEKGTTNGANGVKTDNCLTPAKLKEYYCEAGLVKEELKACLDGCNNGRCR